MSRTNSASLIRDNCRLVKKLYPELPPFELRALIHITRALRLSLSNGEILRLQGRWYVTHAGLLRVATRGRCHGISTTLLQSQSDAIGKRWVFKATVYKSQNARGFVGYGDADPSNVSPAVRGAEMRVAETRAVNRALRKAYGIGLCSVEELGWSPKPSETFQSNQAKPFNVASNGHRNPHARASELGNDAEVSGLERSRNLERGIKPALHRAALASARTPIQGKVVDLSTRTNYYACCWKEVRR